MRVIAGSAKGMPLVTPKGDHTRPTLDKYKETLFNMIAFDVPGAVFVDLFSGSGGIGIEALSRGASSVYLVDNDKEALKCIESNLKFTHLDNNAHVFKYNAVDFIPDCVKEEINIIFMDPPYKTHLEKDILSKIKDSEYITGDTLIIVESDMEADIGYIESLGYEIVKTKKYKTNQHIFIKKELEK